MIHLVLRDGIIDGVSIPVNKAINQTAQPANDTFDSHTARCLIMLFLISFYILLATYVTIRNIVDNAFKKLELRQSQMGDLNQRGVKQGSSLSPTK